MEMTMRRFTAPGFNRCAEVTADDNGAWVPTRSQAKNFSKVYSDNVIGSGSDSRTDHVAVIDHSTGLMWSIESLGDPADEDAGTTEEHCIERCKQLRLLGYDDWRRPTRAELAGLVDDTRYEPAIDTALFPKVKRRWHWTSTPTAWSSASAWNVHFLNGDVSYGRRHYDGFALAVRCAGRETRQRFAATGPTAKP